MIVVIKYLPWSLAQLAVLKMAEEIVCIARKHPVFKGRTFEEYLFCVKGEEEELFGVFLKRTLT